jgi:alpha-tubulin suppressor-like RCC1 family protein
VSGLTNIVDIAASQSRGLAVRSDGSVWRWGMREIYGSGFDLQPVQIAGLSNAVAVAAGYSFNLVLTEDPLTGATRVWSWGENDQGQLGDGSRIFRATPALVPNLTAVRSIAAGGLSAFAVKSNGDVVSWGLGPGGQPSALTPTPVPGLSNIEQVSVVYHVAARDTTGDVWVWGPGNSGESGDGTTNSYWPPVKVPGLSKVGGLATGWSHHVAYRADGSVWAWGEDMFGQIGDGGMSNALIPVQVPLPAGRSAVGVGGGPNWSFALLG